MLVIGAYKNFYYLLKRYPLAIVMLFGLQIAMVYSPYLIEGVGRLPIMSPYICPSLLLVSIGCYGKVPNSRRLIKFFICKVILLSFVFIGIYYMVQLAILPVRSIPGVFVGFIETLVTSIACASAAALIYTASKVDSYDLWAKAMKRKDLFTGAAALFIPCGLAICLRYLVRVSYEYPEPFFHAVHIVFNLSLYLNMLLFFALGKAYVEKSESHQMMLNCSQGLSPV